MTDRSVHTTPSPPHGDPPHNDARADFPRGGDDLDGLLREWHSSVADRAAAARQRVLAATREAASSPVSLRIPEFDRSPTVVIRRLFFSPMSAIAAIILLGVAMIPFALRRPPTVGPSSITPGSTLALFDASPIVTVGRTILAPEAGSMEAYSELSEPLGPCVLRATDVQAEVSGPFARVKLTQRFQNQHPHPVEVAYSLPVPDLAVVDRAQMSVGDRIVLARIGEPDPVQETYTRSLSEGRSPSLVEQSRPNIFVQSIASVPPGGEVIAEVSYVEPIAQSDGRMSFAFPLAVTPRSAAEPSAPRGGIVVEDDSLARKHAASEAGAGGLQSAQNEGVVLRAPARIAGVAPADPPHPSIIAGTEVKGQAAPQLHPQAVAQILEQATIIAPPPPPPPPAPSAPAGPAEPAPAAQSWVFTVEYPDGSAERGQYSADGQGQIANRRFRAPPVSSIKDQIGAGETASPSPGKPTSLASDLQPAQRDGEGVSVSVAIDLGGRPVNDIRTNRYDIALDTDSNRRKDATNRTVVSLKPATSIANDTFQLSWTAPSATPAAPVILTHTDDRGSFFCATFDAPSSVASDTASITISSSGEATPFDVVPAPVPPAGEPNAAADEVANATSIRPLTIVGRYLHPGAATIELSTPRGPADQEWRTSINLQLPASGDQHSALPTAWAAARARSIERELAFNDPDGRTPIADAEEQLRRLGNDYGIPSQVASLSAVEAVRLTIAGDSCVVPIPRDVPPETSTTATTREEMERLAAARVAVGTAGAPATPAPTQPVNPDPDRELGVRVDRADNRDRDAAPSGPRTHTGIAQSMRQAAATVRREVAPIQSPPRFDSRNVPSPPPQAGQNTLARTGMPAAMEKQDSDAPRKSRRSPTDEKLVDQSTGRSATVRSAAPPPPASADAGGGAGRTATTPAAPPPALAKSPGAPDSSMAAKFGQNAVLKESESEVLRARLDARLWHLALSPDEFAKASMTPAQMASCSNVVNPDSRAAIFDSLIQTIEADKKNDGETRAVRVVILLTDTQETTLTTVRDLGFQVEAVAHSANIAVGLIPLNHLRDLAVLSAVRKVEPLAVAPRKAGLYER